MTQQNIIFIWDGKPENYVLVCLQSLRLYNKSCIVHFYYINNNIPKFLANLNINFIKIDQSRWKNKRLHHKLELTTSEVDIKSESTKIAVKVVDIFGNDTMKLMEVNF